MRSLSFVVIASCCLALTLGCSSSSEDAAADEGAATGTDNLTNGPASATRSGPTCRSEERVVFTCRTTNNKIISVCASSDLGPSSGYVQYRFGNENNTEIKLPEDTAVQNFRQITSFGQTDPATSGSFYAESLTFSKDRYSYTVYSQVGHGSEASGVRVTKDEGTLIVDIHCNDDFSNTLDVDAIKRGGIRDTDF